MMKGQKLSNRLGVCSRLLAYLGALSLFVMMLLTAADVVGRYLFNAPILGVFELTEYMVLILIFSFLGYTQSKHAHISVDILVNRMSKRAQAYIDLFNHILCLGLMVLITWMGIKKALELMEVGGISPNLAIPDYPFVFFLVLGCAVMCIEYVRDLIRLIGVLREDVRP